MKAINLLLLASLTSITACTSDPTLDAMNDATWTVQIQHVSASGVTPTAYATRSVDLSSSQPACDPGCTCDYQPIVEAATVDGEHPLGDPNNKKWLMEFTESCPAAHRGLQCTLGFSTDSAGEGCCRETESSTPEGQCGDVQITFARQ